MTISDNILAKAKQIPVLIGKNIAVKNPQSFMKTFADIFSLITDTNQISVPKLQRYFISQSIKDIRPTLKTAYTSWNGIQLIDLDIKNENTARFLKPVLYKYLEKQPWFLGIVLSSSHTGLHLYSYCKTPHDCIEDNYLDHFETITMYVWHALIHIYNIEAKKIGKTKLSSRDITDIHPIYNVSSRQENKNGTLSESKLIDVSMARITQPILIPYDPEPLVNEFFDIQPPIAYNEKNYETLHEGNQLKVKFDSKRGRNLDHTRELTKINSADLPTIDLILPRNYNNEARYRLAYTICNVYDLRHQTDDRYQYLLSCFLRMCSGNPKFDSEKRSFVAVFDSAVNRQMQGICPIIAWALNELMVVHHFKIDADIPEPEIKLSIDIDIDAELSKPVHMPLELVIPYKRIFKLEEHQYVSDGTTEILSELKAPGSKMLLVAEPGTGKTVLITKLMQETEMRVLCVVPYISVIESKFKTLPPEANCQFVYGGAAYDPTASRNAVMTFDKFSKMQVNDLDICFDLIALDESHLLQMSGYRGLVPANTIDNLRATRTPSIVMTGTPIAEHAFLRCTDIVKFVRSRATDKIFNLVICNNPQERFAAAIMHIVNSIKSGRRVIVPSNEGNSFVEKVSNAVQEVLGYQILYHYYKKENNDMCFMHEVNFNQTIGNIDILFCSSYLSVGVDINDLTAFDIVYMEDFTAHEIEQFNNRLRKVDLASYYFIAKFHNSGVFKDNIISRNLPNLRMSNIRNLELSDLLSLHSIDANESGKIVKLYDFFTRHMNMPYIIKQVDGSVKLHSTCYSLVTFENAWRQWSIQIPILIEVLKGYNYQISVINAELMDVENLDKILNAGRDGFRLHKEIIDDNVQFIASKLYNVDFFNVLVYTNSIKLIRKQAQGMEVNLETKKVNIFVQNVNQCYRFMRSIRLLSKYYSRETILRLYDENSETLARLEQVFQTVELLDYASNDRLTTANVEAMQYVLTNIFENQQTARFSRVQMQIHVASIASIYQNLYQLQAETTLERVRTLATSMLKRLATQESKRRGEHTPNDWRLKRIPEFDSVNMQHLETHKLLMYTMFQASLFDSNMNATISEDTKKFFDSSKGFGKQEYVDTDKSIENLKMMESELTLPPALLASIMSYAQHAYPSIEHTTLMKIISTLPGNEDNLNRVLDNKITSYNRGLLTI